MQRAGALREGRHPEQSRHGWTAGVQGQGAAGANPAERRKEEAVADRNPQNPTGGEQQQGPGLLPPSRQTGAPDEREQEQEG